jgi:nickel/cobalt transporter (NiCoT) family protein
MHFIPFAAPRPKLGARNRGIVMMLLLVAANGLAWLWVWAVFNGSPPLIGAAMLAYGLGLRHAVDADHIAAIDNATRKMMEAGRRPVTLGMFFSLGHSAVVFILTLAVVATTATLASLLEPVRAFLSVVGTTLSLMFLVVVAGLNLVTLFSLGRALRRAENGGNHAGHAHGPAAGGFLACLLAPLSRCVTRSWHMFFVGFLFGLSFETASEISLLSLSVTEMTNGLSPSLIFVFPALFAAGMSLLDAADGAMMVGVYGWAFTRPNRRLMYNFIITSLSVVVALFIAGIGFYGLLAAVDEKDDGGISLPGPISFDMTSLGYLVVFTFAAVWLIAIAVSRFGANSPVTRHRPRFGMPFSH